LITIDYRDKRPLYEQVTEKLMELILNGVLPGGSQLPSVRQLAADLSVNPNTVQRAYAKLEDAGVAYPVSGRGFFVSDDLNKLRRTRWKNWEHKLFDLLDEGQKLGLGEESIRKAIEEFFVKEKENTKGGLK